MRIMEFRKLFALEVQPTMDRMLKQWEQISERLAQLESDVDGLRSRVWELEDRLGEDRRDV
jgi:hypothetical protein